MHFSFHLTWWTIVSVYLSMTYIVDSLLDDLIFWYNSFGIRYHKNEVVLGFSIIPFKFVSAHNDYHPIKDSTPHEARERERRYRKGTEETKVNKRSTLVITITTIAKYSGMWPDNKSIKSILIKWLFILIRVRFKENSKLYFPSLEQTNSNVVPTILLQKK